MAKNILHCRIIDASGQSIGTLSLPRRRSPSEDPRRGNGPENAVLSEYKRNRHRVDDLDNVEPFRFRLRGL